MKQVALFLVLAAVTLAQTPDPEKKAMFEVASVKPSATTDGSLTFDFPAGGRFTARNLTLQMLLRIAYQLEDYQISGGPAWIKSAGFDIQAKGGEGTGEPRREQVLQMVQAMLADRFQLAVHRETRELPIYVLVTGKTGPRLQAADSNVGRPKTMLGQMIVQKMSMTTLANILVFDLKRPVKDETGLKGEFAFTLEWTPGLSESDDGPASRPSLFTAVQEQLGLKLESARGPVEIVVVDKAEKPSEN
jgi:uncharacterized protein (TIGR03435 family)